MCAGVFVIQIPKSGVARAKGKCQWIFNTGCKVSPQKLYRFALPTVCQCLFSYDLIPAVCVKVLFWSLLFNTVYAKNFFCHILSTDTTTVISNFISSRHLRTRIWKLKKKNFYLCICCKIEKRPNQCLEISGQGNPSEYGAQVLKQIVL